MLRNKGYCVYHGFKGYSKPLIKNVMVEISDKGFTDVVCVQMFMTGGRYSEVVIPKQLGIKRGTMSGNSNIGGRSVNVQMTDPIGTHRLMTDIIVDIVDTVEIKGNNRGVLLFGGGSLKPENSFMVEQNVKRLRERGMFVQ